MCGIAGYTGSGVAKNFVLKTLKKLDYRGYDSAGVSFFENNALKVVKVDRRVEQLEQKLKSQSILNHNVCFESEKIRDCIGIYRVVVKRLQALFGSYGISEFMRDEIEIIERIYLRLEYMNLRRNYDIEKINVLLDEAICIQKKIKRKALERMEIIYEQCRREDY